MTCKQAARRQLKQPPNRTFGEHDVVADTEPSTWSQRVGEKNPSSFCDLFFSTVVTQELPPFEWFLASTLRSSVLHCDFVVR